MATVKATRTEVTVTITLNESEAKKLAALCDAVDWGSDPLFEQINSEVRFALDCDDLDADSYFESSSEDWDCVSASLSCFGGE